MPQHFSHLKRCGECQCAGLCFNFGGAQRGYERGCCAGKCGSKKEEIINFNNVQNRYVAFGRMSRQYAFLQRMKRGGIGHMQGGIDAAGQGIAVVHCWACPKEGVNLPSNWRDMDPKYA